MRLAVAVVAVVAGCAGTRAADIEALPLRAGTRWTYVGKVTIPDPKDGRRSVTHDVTWTVTVKSVERMEKRVVSRVEGDLTDLDFWDPQRRPSEVFVIKNGSRYYRAHTAEEDGDLFLEWPVDVGSKVCPDTGDERGCWVVDKIDRATLSGVKGAPSGARPHYVMSQHDNTGVQEMEMVPGVGITAYRYHHRGSTSDVDVRLAEVKVGKR